MAHRRNKTKHQAWSMLSSAAATLPHTPFGLLLFSRIKVAPREDLSTTAHTPHPLFNLNASAKFAPHLSLNMSELPFLYGPATPERNTQKKSQSKKDLGGDFLTVAPLDISLFARNPIGEGPVDAYMPQLGRGMSSPERALRLPTPSPKQPKPKTPTPRREQSQMLSPPPSGYSTPYFRSRSPSPSPFAFSAPSKTSTPMTSPVPSRAVTPACDGHGQPASAAYIAAFGSPRNIYAPSPRPRYATPPPPVLSPGGAAYPPAGTGSPRYY
uniref:Uncharacterized protein n=1 Tax=Mycena chlorophos TaxID=658473 RepID=A0ABQ0L4H9_MYCCL|nr:predicted protein [Mycena chlorophos]